MGITNYFFLIITGLVSLLYFFRALKLIFNGKVLQHKFFDFPDDKFYKIGYCFCIVVLGIVVIFLRLN